MVTAYGTQSQQQMADDFDFGEGDEGHSSAGGKSLVDELFGSSRRPASAAPKSKLAIDDLLPSGGTITPPKRKPTVTFQDPPLDSNPLGTQQPIRPKGTSIAAPPSANLIESLFAGPGGRKEGAAVRPVRERDQSPPTALPGAPKASARVDPADQSMLASQQLAAKDHEIDQLRKELSTLRVEKSDDQRTINELHKRLENTLQEHQRVVEKLNQAHRDEFDSIRSVHAREMDDVVRKAERSDEIMGAMKRQEGSLDAFAARFDTLALSLNSISDELHSFGSREGDVEKVLALAEQKFSQLLSQLDAERCELARQKEESTKRMESELSALSQRYTEEIVEGRRWLVEETRRVQAQRLAFQEEQSSILDSIESKKSELDTLKQRFLASEHDLLLRVVNERALLEQQRRQFERQRGADVARLRAEAENLERYVLEVDQTQRALSASKLDYEAKLAELRELKNLLAAYEREIYASEMGMRDSMGK